MSLAWSIVLLAYLAGVVLVTALARILDDPYDHFPPRKDWWQAVVTGVLWPVMLAYVVGVVAYYTILERLERKRRK